MPGTFQLSVVTPEREVLATEARFVAVPAHDGEIGVLARRAPLLAQLGAGLLRVEEASGAKRSLFVAGGFAQMVDDKLTLLTEEAREPSQLDGGSAVAQLRDAQSLPARSEAEIAKKERALSRARTLKRLSR